MTRVAGTGPRPNLTYRIAYPIVRAAIGTRVHYVRCGVEQIPAEGAFIFVANHTRNLDPFTVTFALPTERPASFLAKQEMFRKKLQNWFFRAVHQYPVDRGKPDRGAIRYATDWLGAGGVLGIFPQGTRSAPGPVEQAEQGAAFIAFLSMARVVPVGIVNGPKRSGMKRQTVVVAYGPTLDPADYMDLPKRERMERFTAEYVAGINAALEVANKRLESGSCA